MTIPSDPAEFRRWLNKPAESLTLEEVRERLAAIKSIKEDNSPERAHNERILDAWNGIFKARESSILAAQTPSNPTRPAVLGSPFPASHTVPPSITKEDTTTGQLASPATPVALPASASSAPDDDAPGIATTTAKDAKTAALPVLAVKLPYSSAAQLKMEVVHNGKTYKPGRDYLVVRKDTTIVYCTAEEFAVLYDRSKPVYLVPKPASSSAAPSTDAGPGAFI